MEGFEYPRSWEILVFVILHKLGTEKTTPQLRVKVSPGEQLIVYSVKCKFCQEELNMKDSTVQNYVEGRENGQKGGKEAKYCGRQKGIQCKGASCGGAPT